MKQQYGQYFSRNAELINHFRDRVKPHHILIDPFAGDHDLLNQFNNSYEAYDLFPLNSTTVYNNSLLTPISYQNKFILTNPPFLNINKSEDKEVFELYETDDLYKAALKTIISTGEEGIIIVPSAFWFNEKSAAIRKEFLEVFNVPEVMIFNKQMFEDTTYTVSSFYFKRGTSAAIKFNIVGNNPATTTLTFSPENNYSIVEDVEQQLLRAPYKIGRYTKQEQTPTNIYLRCIDTSSRIGVELKEPYLGKSSDRAFLTFTTDVELTTEQQAAIVDMFNNELERLRLIYSDAFLSNYRNGGRKRISFSFAYKLFGHCLMKIQQEVRI